MKLERIVFTGLRNLEDCDVRPHPAVNVIYGQNAQGKTNFLEGVWLFTGQKSFRNAREAQLIRFGQATAQLQVEWSRSYGKQTLQENAMLRLGEKREIQINQVEQTSPLALAERFHAVIFSPLHLRLVENGPEIRRRFLDVAVGQLYPRYGQLLREYLRAVSQRNAILRDSRTHAGMEELLDSFETAAARLGARILRYRQRYTQLLQEKAPVIYEGISGGRERLTLRYAPSLKLEPEAGEEAMVRALQTALEQSRREDSLTGGTSVGPHRDDLALFINEQLIRSYGSQGQKRSAVLALKLAESQILFQVTGEPPVVLLDDVMSELDTARQAYILNHISEWQVFLTCCDPAPLPTLDQGRVFLMEAGKITPRSDYVFTSGTGNGSEKDRRDRHL